MQNNILESKDATQSVANRVREMRKIRGLTLQKMADALGVSYQQVQKYENSKNRISAAALYKIAQLLGAPISYFFDSIDAPDVEPLGNDVLGLVYAANGLSTRDIAILKATARSMAKRAEE